MSEQNTRQYINGVWIEEKVFSDDSSILKLSVLPEKFIESLKAAKKNEKGYVKLVISKRRELGKNNETHTCYVDTWQPTNKPTATFQGKTAKPAPSRKPQVNDESEQAMF